MRHALVIALIAATPLVADAKPKKKGGKAKVEFKQHMDAGTKAHKDGNYDVALTELQAAYAIDAQPKLLFAIAQVQAKLDLCPEAVANYEKFLGTIKKDKKKTAVVKQAINACNDKIAAAAAIPEPTPEPATATPSEPTPPSEDSLVAPAGAPEAAPLPQAVDDSPLPPSAMPPPVTVSAKPWYKDVLGDVLLVGGVAVGVGSIVVYTGARATLDDAEAAPSLADYESLLDDAKSQRTVSIMLAGGSVVLITAALLRYKLRDKGETRAVAVTPTNGGGLITWSGGF